MRQNLILGSVVAATMLLLSGCGGGDSAPAATSTSTGTIIDAPIKGLSYETPTQHGFTDSAGHFKYKAGETVTFKLGNILLGSAQGGSLLTPYSIANDDNTTAVNIAMLLQNFDANRSDDSIIDVSKLKDFNFTASDFNLSDTAGLKSKITDLLSTGSFQDKVDSNTSLLDETIAKTRMDDFIQGYKQANGIIESFTEDFLKGKIFTVKFSQESNEIKFDFTGTKSSFTNENIGYESFNSGYNTADGMVVIKDGKLYEFTYNYDAATNTRTYNDGVNIYTVKFADDEKITTTMKYPDGEMEAYFYIQNDQSEDGSTENIDPNGYNSILISRYLDDWTATQIKSAYEAVYPNYTVEVLDKDLSCTDIGFSTVLDEYEGVQIIYVIANRQTCTEENIQLQSENKSETKTVIAYEHPYK